MEVLKVDKENKLITIVIDCDFGTEDKRDNLK
jgi:hypothetical protein